MLKNKFHIHLYAKANTIRAHRFLGPNMEQQRYIDTGSNSFFRDYLYDQVVPQGHFPRKLKKSIDWSRFTRKLIKLYKGEGVVGRPPFDPALMLKVEMIAYLYKLSERQVEMYIHENLPAKFFVGLAVDQKAPDHSTMTVFRERLIRRGKLKVFEKMLEEIVHVALRSGKQFGSIELNLRLKRFSISVSHENN